MGRVRILPTVAWVVLAVSVKRRRSLIKTLSVWSGVAGLLLTRYGSRQAKLAGIGCLVLVGIGGVGVSYGSVATKLNIPLEPYQVIREARKRRAEVSTKDELQSAIWHGLFAVLAFQELRNILKES